MSKSLYFKLSQESLKTPVESLHIGDLASQLSSGGIETVGTLAYFFLTKRKKTLESIGISKRNIIFLEGHISSIEKLLDEKGHINWDEYNKYFSRPTQTEPLLLNEVSNGDEFIDSFPIAIDAIIKSRETLVDRLILGERLTKLPHERKTLEQISALIPEKLTRERVRQREAKILSLIANAFLYGRQRWLGIKFSENFLSYWRLAAEHFGSKSQISFNDFISELEDAWKVSPDKIFSHLPFILAVLTSKAKIPAPLKHQLKYETNIYKNLDAREKEIPISKLALGKAAEEIISSDIQNLGALFEAVRNSSKITTNGQVGRSIQKVIYAISKGVQDDGTINWNTYERILGLTRIPKHEPQTIVNFLENISNDIESIIEINKYSKNAVGIFKLRISASPQDRLTLASTASALNTHGPSIKREETILLSNLNNLLIRQDLTCSDVVFSNNYLNFWEEANQIYKKSEGKYDDFCSLAFEQWQISKYDYASQFHIIYSILNQYPSSHIIKRKSKALTKKDTEQENSGIIILRGFRYIH